MTLRSFTILPLADGKLSCSRCRAKLRTGDSAETLLDDGYVEHRHAGACPSNIQPLPDPDAEWHIQGSNR